MPCTFRLPHSHGQLRDAHIHSAAPQVGGQDGPNRGPTGHVIAHTELLAGDALAPPHLQGEQAGAGSIRVPPGGRVRAHVSAHSLIHVSAADGKGPRVQNSYACCLAQQCRPANFPGMQLLPTGSEPVAAPMQVHPTISIYAAHTALQKPPARPPHGRAPLTLSWSHISGWHCA
jgi:hypothetical protein